jgi:hypothetical protein
MSSRCSRNLEVYAGPEPPGGYSIETEMKVSNAPPMRLGSLASISTGSISTGIRVVVKRAVHRSI